MVESNYRILNFEYAFIADELDNERYVLVFDLVEYSINIYQWDDRTLLTKLRLPYDFEDLWDQSYD